MITKEELCKCSFFSEFSPTELLFILQNCREVEVGKNKYLAHEGENAKNFYLLLSGKAQIEIHSNQLGPRVIQSVQDGELVGWSWLFSPNTWIFDVKVVEKAKWLECSGDAFLKEMESNHEFGYKFMKKVVRVMTERLKATRLQVLDIYGAST
jgi:CRP-like cAMP-binding protein